VELSQLWEVLGDPEEEYEAIQDVKKGAGEEYNRQEGGKFSQSPSSDSTRKKGTCRRKQKFRRDAGWSDWLKGQHLTQHR